MFNRTTILFISLFVSIIQIFPQTYNLLETIKFATKEKKLAEIKNIKTLPKKEFETVFKIIIEEQDPDLCTELIQNLDNILPVETVLPQIVKLFSAQQIQQHPKLASAIKNYLLQNRDRDYTYSYIKELILSDTTELQIKF
ncbi:MAG: hypothetical protein NZ839_04980, partial [Endomicrobia bacterium]|nr:hypothetical protein [Endomicrobiia bacterium]